MYNTTIRVGKLILVGTEFESPLTFQSTVVADRWVKYTPLCARNVKGRFSLAILDSRHPNGPTGVVLIALMLCQVMLDYS